MIEPVEKVLVEQRQVLTLIGGLMGSAAVLCFCPFGEM